MRAETIQENIPLFEEIDDILTMKTRLKFIERKALRVIQESGQQLYLLCLTGDEVLQIAGVSRVSRDDSGKIIGYQRAEVRKHVKEIADYLKTPGMILAHPLILSFGSQVKFISSRGQKTTDGLSVAGMLRIPYSKSQENKPAWIVDGQQRALAISQLKDKTFPVPICAFVADDIELQRDQFLRINNTKPLPRGLVTELLPEVSTSLPPNLALRKVPSAICEMLNREDSSPFKGLIRRTSTPVAERAKAVISDGIVVKMIADSLTHTSGCLFPYRNVATGETDHQGIWAVLHLFWTAVRETFPDAWAKPSTKSRLMHGIGIRSMGKLMDRIMGSIDPRDKNAGKLVRLELQVIAPHCHWTSGRWDALGGVSWNELQNLHKHLSMLSNFLIRTHFEHRHL
jgi:DGQHR domain-containing protein